VGADGAVRQVEPLAYLSVREPLRGKLCDLEFLGSQLIVGRGIATPAPLARRPELASSPLAPRDATEHVEGVARYGPAILVGHSYGGAVITEAGTHSSVAGLVYITAFAPDQDESVNTLIADPPPGAPVPPILPPQDGFLFLDREKFADSFAADLPAREAAFMADSQVPWGVEALNGAVSDPAWRSKPSWYLIATEDRMIPPPAQRAMAERAGATTAEASGSHFIYVSQPSAVASLITQAARSLRDNIGVPA
jgi:pimeloyl-ACP methyl ester carboxylesterase